MCNLVCMLEEPSAKEMLKAVLPKILPANVIVRYIVFEGKQDMEKRLESRVRGWNMPDSFFLIMRDQDSGDCIKIKKKLMSKVTSSKRRNTLIRIACHELESFYLGDLEAVERGLAIENLSDKQNSRLFRDPDRMANPAEILARVSGQSYQKIQGSRNISPFLKLDGSNRSTSFKNLISGLQKLKFF